MATLWPKTQSIKSHNFEFFFLLFFLIPPSSFLILASRVEIISSSTTTSSLLPAFREASAFRNAENCQSPLTTTSRDKITIAMTLDANYLRGTMAAVFSILQHTSCPESVTFHFISANNNNNNDTIPSVIRSTFPFLDFRVHFFDTARVQNRISRSIRRALDQPLNYARIYLADLLPADVDRVLYLDSDIIVVDDIQKLWDVELDNHVVAAPEYCHTDFTKYFTDKFWADKKLSSTFDGRKPCYFNTGVMVVDVKKWRRGQFTKMVENWMMVQKMKRIYHLGSLPPFLLVLAGNIKAVDHRWNQHGLGGDNIEGKCRTLNPGPISLLHWSGKGKPWLRLDARKPCTVDYLWAPYDLYRSPTPTLED